MSSSASSSGSSSRQSGSFNSDYSSSSASYYSDMSVVSTPSKRGVAGATDHRAKPLVPHLQKDLQDKFSSGVPLVDFVVHVWGLDRAVAMHILSNSWTLPAEALDSYRVATPEPQMYVPFAQIADALVKDTGKEVSQFLKRQREVVAAMKAAETSIYFWNDRGVRTLYSAVTKRKPDMLVVDKLVVDITPTWSLAHQVIEFKRKSNVSAEAAFVVSSSSAAYPPSRDSASVGRFSAAGSSSHLRKPKTASTAGSTSGTKRRQSSQATSDAPMRELRPRGANGLVTSTASSGGRSNAFMPSPASSQKRKHDGTHDGKDPKRPRTAKKQKVPTITLDQLQLASHALECLDASTRHYASGVFIDRFRVSVWYYDRACVISSEVFRFDTNPEQLALVLYALSACDNRHAGFDPYLSIPTSINLSSRPKEHPHWQDIIGSVFDLPPSDNYPGRGKFRIEDTLFAYRGLIGRGTMVYQVAPVTENRCESEALKINWPVLTRPLEGKTIERLHSRLSPQWREHLPEVTFSATMTAEQLELPRVELLKMEGHAIDEFEDRQMHALAMKLCGKLWEAGSVEAFQEVFVDCVECHYHAYTDADVLHRDLSENNLMFRPGEDPTNVKGILNDWDMASYVGDNHEIPLSTAKHRTGTIPFMARDLLDDDPPPPHLYRHDLESFFYILVWAALHYDFSRKERLPRVAKLNSWDAPLFEAAQHAKKTFISDRSEKNRVFSLVLPEAQSLLPWMSSLWALFSEGNTAFQRDGELPGWDDMTLSGHITFEKFMQALGRTPR